MENIKIIDYIGVGLGPFNIGLAALSEKTKLKSLFFDQKDTFDWHPGMLLNDAHLQVPFIADFVSLADPTSPFSFLNYLKENNRIYKFYIRENFYILRKEYNKYCIWVLEQLNNCKFNHRVEQIHKVDNYYKVLVKNKKTKNIETYYAKHIVLGVGTSPWIPDFAKKLNKDQCIHTGSYLFHKSEILKQKKISIIGGGQSAAEIFMDLLTTQENYDFKLEWYTRSERFSPLEYSKLTLEMTSPEYVDYFYELPQAKKNVLNQEHKFLYKGINFDLINAIYDVLYEKSVENDLDNVIIKGCIELKDVLSMDNGDIELSLKQTQTHESYTDETSFIVMATGYKSTIPSFLKPIKELILWDTPEKYKARRNYSIDIDERIFVQNAEQNTHGFVTPDLGMSAYRNSIILNQILGKPFYKVDTRIAFQEFGTPKQHKKENFILNKVNV
ncbi:lysine N6-hydroxylase [Wenyingzhuangia heitensis]|uniref:Lysine N6-hydroxylase n=1 Tax=Wenyingzhuangia heitensis TaxID=1487859 RepID=A0ABX0U6J2_9FLAO|nr:SidA/IucD/PvdA family monooxygenase [Wenyingzhuangia heitensis]NIJ44459.1 lysine N6-hydroxylase [Wenyingzhuangia heitensis]